MTKIRKSSYPPINIGTSFMLMIFIILCMIIFAVLSFSSALKDYNYSQKNASRTTAYYQANNQAEIYLSDIDAVLLQNLPMEEQIQKLQESGDFSVSAAEAGNGLTITFTVPMEESSALQVVLATHPEGEERYTITTWKQITTTEWTGNQTLPVLGSH